MVSVTLLSPGHLPIRGSFPEQWLIISPCCTVVFTTKINLKVHLFNVSELEMQSAADLGEVGVAVSIELVEMNMPFRLKPSSPLWLPCEHEIPLIFPWLRRKIEGTSAHKVLFGKHIWSNTNDPLNFVESTLCNEESSFVLQVLCVRSYLSGGSTSSNSLYPSCTTLFCSSSSLKPKHNSVLMAELLLQHFFMASITCWHLSSW